MNEAPSFFLITNKVQIMKAAKCILLLVVPVMLVYPVISQDVVPGSDLLLAKLRLNESMSGAQYSSYDEIEGDPYIFKEFRQGLLVLKTGEKANADMRYDINADLIHIRLKDIIFAIGFPEKVLMVEIDNLKFINDVCSRQSSRDTPEKRSWFIVQEEGKCTLLIKKNMRIQDPEPAKILQEAKPARFIHTADTYYLKLQNSNSVLINTKSELLSMLSDHKEEIIMFMKSERLEFNKLEDLSSIIRYYNEL